METVTQKSLEKKFPGEGESRLAQLAELGGFGTIGTGEGGLDPNSSLDLAGVLDPENKAVSLGHKNKIRELAGLDAPAESEPEAPADGGKGKAK